MKRKILISFICFCPLLLSCTKENELPLSSNDLKVEIPGEVNIIPETVALDRFKDFLSTIPESRVDTKSDILSDVSSINLVLLRESPYTKVEIAKRTYAAYIVNFNNDGFAVLGGQDGMPSVIAYSDNGYLDYRTLSLSGVDSDFIGQMILNGITSESTENDISTKASTDSVSPLLNMMWTQEQVSQTSCYYNKYCYMTVSGTNNNNVPCGCSVLAGAMIIAYNGYPTSFTINGRTLNWNNLSLYSEPNGVQAEEDAALLIGQLFNDCNGKVAFKEGTMVTPRQIELRLKDYGYSNVGRLQGSHFTSNMKSKTSTMLKNNSPVFLSALGTSNVEGSGIYGHSWVVDGYKYNGDTMLVHCNWGWHGKGNGYFATNCFRTRDGYSYDNVYDANHLSSIPLQNFSYHYRLVYYDAVSGTKTINKTF